MTDRMLGAFEQLVLLAVLRLDEDQAYAVPLRRLIEERAQRRVTRGALYTCLDRLERKGHLDSVLGESTPERGGRPKRYYSVTDTGLAALRETRQSLLDSWRGLESVLGDARR